MPNPSNVSALNSLSPRERAGVRGTGPGEVRGTGSGRQTTLVLDEWIPRKQAAHILNVSIGSVRRLETELDPFTNEPYLETWRPLTDTVLILAESVASHLRATRSDPEFWEKRKALRAAHRK